MDSSITGSLRDMASFAAMPVEIIQRICRELADDSGSLASLARTCRSINRTVTPIFYRHLDDSNQSSVWPGAYTPIILQSILNNSPGIYPAFCRTMRQLFDLEVLHACTLEDAATVMAVACLAPELSTLEMPPAALSRGNTDFMVNKVDRRIAGSRQQCTLHNLTRLTVRPAGDPMRPIDGGSVNFAVIDGLLWSAPNLQSLVIEGAARAGTALTARLPNVTNLCLPESQLCYFGLRSIIQACGKLTRFEYDHYGYGHNCAELGVPASPGQIIELLATSRDTLEQLHLAPFIPDSRRHAELLKAPRCLLIILDGFSALKRVAVDCRAIERRQGDDGWLNRLVWHCPALESLFLTGLEKLPSQEIACFTRGVIEGLQWEFVSVYRMHSQIPDTIAFFSSTTGKHIQTIPVSDLTFSNAQTPLRQNLLTFPDLLYSFGINYPGAITNNNYPTFLRNLPTPDGQTRDLGTVDILRDRERGVPRYCQFRRLLRMSVPKTFEELTGGNKVLADELRETYNGDVELVDSLVGMHSEPLIPGFGFSETAFRIFILMASRRLKSDRFIAGHGEWSAGMYTKVGFDWVQISGMKDVSGRHFPELKGVLEKNGGRNVFAPWVKMPESENYQGIETNAPA